MHLNSNFQGIIFTDFFNLPLERETSFREFGG